MVNAIGFSPVSITKIHLDPGQRREQSLKLRLNQGLYTPPRP